MSRPTANPELTASHYTRAAGGGEANKATWGRLPWTGPDAPTPPQPIPTQPTEEITMLRICTIATLIALTSAISTAQAGTKSVAERIHDAAVTACAPESAPGMGPRAHYGAIENQCVYRISRAAMNKYEALAAAKGEEHARLANN